MSAAAGLVHLAGHLSVVFLDVLVAVPVAAREAVVGAAPDLHEAHAALEQPPGHQAARAEVLGQRLVHAVKLADLRRLLADIERFRGAQLQPRRHLVGLDAGFELGVLAARRHVGAIDLLQRVQRGLLDSGVTNPASVGGNRS